MDISKYTNKTITAVSFNDGLYLTFDDKSQCYIYDNAQYCCERRWATCDDDINVLIGGQLISIEVTDIDYGAGESDFDEEDIQCVKVQTTTGFITIFNHNEHNGYYGGFELAIS
jgi:hypothetical protein